VRPLGAVLLLMAACSHEEAAQKGAATPGQGQAAQGGEQPQAGAGAAGGEAMAPVAAPAPGAPQTAPGGAPGAAPAPRRDSQFAPVATGQQPIAETAAAERAVRGGNYELAIQESKRALSRNERYVPAMVILAKAYFALHKNELCASILDTAGQIDDHNGEIYFLRGHLALSKDDKPAALAAFKAATDRDPAHASAWNDLAAQYLVAHNFDGAQAAAARAVQIAPNFVKAHINLGSAMRGLKQYREAESEYRRALQLDPNNATVYFNLGILYLDADQFPGLDTMARLDQAIAHLQRYKQMASYRLSKDDPADSYIDEASKARERERKKQERLRKEAERGQPKPAPAGPASPAGPPGAPGAPPGGAQPAPQGAQPAPQGGKPK